MAKEVKEIVFPSNPADRKIISNSINELVSSLTRTQAEKDIRKEIVTTTKENYDIPPAMMNKWAGQAYDLESKSAEDAKLEIIETGFQIFIAADSRLSGSGSGITQEEIDERKAEQEEMERLEKEQAAIDLANQNVIDELDADPVIDFGDDDEDIPTSAEELEAIVKQVEADELDPFADDDNGLFDDL